MITPESTNRKTYKSFDSHLFILWVLIAILISASAVGSITVILVISFITPLLLLAVSCGLYGGNSSMADSRNVSPFRFAWRFFFL